MSTRNDDIDPEYEEGPIEIWFVGMIVSLVVIVVGMIVASAIHFAIQWPIVALKAAVVLLLIVFVPYYVGRGVENVLEVDE